MDILGQMTIHRSFPLENTERKINVEMKNLSPGMNLSISSSRTRDGDGGLTDCADYILDGLLDCSASIGRLDLPSGIIKPIIADNGLKALLHASQRTSIAPNNAAAPASSR